MSDKLYQTVHARSLEQFNEKGEQIADALRSNVLNHDNPADGFKPQAYDLSEYPYQSPDCIRVSGKNAGSEVLRGLAGEINNLNVDPIIEHYSKRPDLLNHIADRLKDGKDVGVVTDHSSVIGVAVAGGALACALYEGRYATADKLRTGIFVSSMIKHTQLQGALPTVDVLAGIFSETFFSLPPSKSIRDSEIPKEYRYAFNAETKPDFETQLDKDDGMLVMLAGSGSRDKLGTRRFRRKQIFMGPLANGTVDILKRLYSLPVGLEIQEDKSEMFVDSLRRPIQSEEDAHRIMGSIATGMSNKAKTRRKYYRTRELFNTAWEDTEEHKDSLKKAKD